MNYWYRWLFLMAVVAWLPGCGGGVKPVSGGTQGVLHAGSELLGDFQVTVHQVEGGSSKPIGLAVTGIDGSFALVTNGAQGPLTLAPGEYLCTLESVGAPTVFPMVFGKPETTPLKISWSSSDTKLDLDVPAPKTPGRS